MTPAGAVLPSMAGSVVEQGGALCFVPRFPFLGGVPYAIDIDGVAAGVLVRAEAGHPASTSVIAIHPGVREVPRNLLRLYVSFSAAMSEGLAGRHVRLFDDTGAEMRGALLATEHELWDPSRRRLTLLLDPARIKRGLRPHREAGYPLQAGSSFRVVVDEGFLDARGAPLVAAAARRYAVGADERRRVRPEHWAMGVPAAGSTDALVVTFDRPLDHALVASCLQVTDPGGLPLRGSSGTPGATGSGTPEHAWSFRPARPWGPGPHHLVVDPVLEDLAGNSVRREFDRDVSAHPGAPADGAQVDGAPADGAPADGAPVTLAFTPGLGGPPAP